MAVDASLPPGRRLVVYAGSNKTATTWLQSKVLPTLDVRLVGTRSAPSPHPVDAELLPALRALTIGDGFVPGRVGRLVDEVEDDRTVVISEEGITAALRHRSFDDLRRSLERLHDELPDASMVLVVRRQDHHIESNYLQYVRMGGTGSLARFVSDRRPHGPFDPRLHDFASIRDEIVQRWPTCRVVPFELLKEDRAAFLRAVLVDLGLSSEEIERLLPLGAEVANPSLSVAASVALRWVNRLDPQRIEDQRRGRPVSRRARLTGMVGQRVRAIDQAAGLSRTGSDRWMRERRGPLLEELLGTDAASNRRLAEATGLDLESYGYF